MGCFDDFVGLYKGLFLAGQYVQLVVVVILFPLSLILSISRQFCGGEPNKSDEEEEPKPKKKTETALCLDLCQAIGYCCWSCCPFSCVFSHEEHVSLTSAMERYIEIDPPVQIKPFERSLNENEFLTAIMSLLHEKQPNFYFKELAAGSLRERFGKMLPSTSVLATDYDFMIIPDTITVSDDVNDLTSSFTATEDPRDNPDTPRGYLWLKYNPALLKIPEWANMSSKRQFEEQVLSFLPQVKMYDLIKNAIGNKSELRKIAMKTDTIRENDIDIEIFRSGPALTVIVKARKWGLSTSLCRSKNLGYDDKELFHADFMIAIHSPNFPKIAQDWFVDRNKQGKIWPPQEVIEKIQKLGCHVVPKPSKQELFQFMMNQNPDPVMKSNGLEWRYSFSQAEMILSDAVNEKARMVYLALKAAVKKHVNVQPHYVMQSYILKSTFYRVLETKSDPYWEQPGCEERFFHELLGALRTPFADAKPQISHYWIPSINLLQDYVVEQTQHFQQRLESIAAYPLQFVADNWLEYQRCLRLNCFECCLPLDHSHDDEENGGEEPVEPGCCKIMIENFKQCCLTCHCSYTDESCCCGPTRYDPLKFDNY